MSYKRIFVKNKYRYEHRYLMEKYLDRELLSNELVHHINGNKKDNRIENLEVIVNKKEHMQKHLRLKSFWKKRKMQ